jgi:hypothetical protein
MDFFVFLCFYLGGWIFLCFLCFLLGCLFKVSTDGDLDLSPRVSSSECADLFREELCIIHIIYLSDTEYIAELIDISTFPGIPRPFVVPCLTADHWHTMSRVWHSCVGEARLAVGHFG